jgi:2-polyprenyl-3-methyl-5-hydroxy-6-metoxy-1,4-benzoquinol methylase
MELYKDFYESQTYADRSNPYDFNIKNVREFFKQFITGANNIILDASCNKGTIDNELQSYGKVYGVDISKKIIQEAKNFSPQSKYIINNVMQLSFKNCTFDIIISMHTIEHLYEPQLFLNECYRVLKNNGFLLMTWPPTNEYSMINKNDCNYIIDKHIWNLPINKIFEFCENASFKKINDYTCKTMLGGEFGKAIDSIIFAAKNG